MGQNIKLTRVNVGAMCMTWETAHCAAAMAVLATVAALTRLLSVTHASLRIRQKKRDKDRKDRDKANKLLLLLLLLLYCYIMQVFKGHSN